MNAAPEVLLLCKTKAARFDAIVACIQSLRQGFVNNDTSVGAGSPRPHAGEGTSPLHGMSPSLQNRVLHSYETPEIIAIPT